MAHNNSLELAILGQPNIGNHMPEHATHIQGTRAAIERSPTQPQRILAEAEVAWGYLLASTVGLVDDDLDTMPSDGGWTIRHILEHIRNSEANYLAAIQDARTKLKETE
jgi:hypothetical protein